MSHKEKLSGVFPPVMTPFLDEEVAYNKLAENIEKYNETDLTGYMPLGSNGEFRSLTEEESLKSVDVIQKSKSPEKTLMVGAGRESAKATIEFIKKIEDKGVDYASVLTPHYFTSAMTDEALIKYYTVVAERSKIPIMIYNAPKFCAGLTISANVISALAEHPNIVGMKDTSKEDISIYLKAVPSGADFYILAGTISKFYKSLLAGAVGGVLSMANYLPDMCCELYEIYLSGDTEKGQKKDEYVRQLSSNAASKYGVAGVKAAMNLLGYFGGEPRIPLPALDEKEVAELRAVLEGEGLL